MDDRFPVTVGIPPRALKAALRLSTRRAGDRGDPRLAAEEDAARATIMEHLAQMGYAPCIATAILALDPAVVRMVSDRYLHSVVNPGFHQALAWMARRPQPLIDAADLCKAWARSDDFLIVPIVGAALMVAASTQGDQGARALIGKIFAFPYVHNLGAIALDILTSTPVLDTYRPLVFASAVDAMAPHLCKATAFESGVAALDLGTRPAAFLALLAAGLPIPSPMSDEKRGTLARDIHRRMSTAHGRMEMLAWRGRGAEAVLLDDAQALAILT